MRPLLRRRARKGAAEFYLRRPENLLLVKTECDGGLLVCATAGNLSTEQRAAFVRYLGEEGFVSSVFLEPSDCSAGPSSDGGRQSVRWIVDPTWPEMDPAYARHLQRLCWYIAGTVMIWFALVVVLVLC